jgi:hypothetical protein
MPRLIPDEAAQVDAHVRQHGVTKLPRVREFTTLPMVPHKQPGRRSNSRFRRGARTMADATAIPDDGILPDAGW